jgi:DNA-binding transcriptional LysR family regulator
LDLAIVITHGPVPDIDQQLLATDEVVLAVPVEHWLGSRADLDLTEVADEPFIEFPLGWGVRSAVDMAFAAAGVSRRITVQLNDMSTILDLVRLGLGIAFVPLSVAERTDDLHYLRIRGSRPTYRIAIARAAGRPLGPVARRFLSIAAVDRSAP